MEGLLRRLVSSLVLTALGGVLGAWVGWIFDFPVVATLAGTMLGTALAVSRDSVKAYRLADWLRGSQRDPAPRDAGLWGELGYRTEKVLRKREVALKEERQQREEFLSGIEASPNGVLLLDRNDQIDWCNSVAAEHFGLDLSRDLRQRITNLVRSPAFVSFVQAGVFTEPITFARPRGDGSLSVLVRVYGNQKKLLLSQDITDREKTDLMRRDFVANVSHEIRTPLTVLSGYVESLATLQLDESERHRVLMVMQQQSRRMQALVDDLLTLAQLEGGARPAPDRWFALGAVLRRVEVDGVALSAGRHRIVVDADIEVELAGIESEWVSAVGNLLSNAIRYTPDGGRIDLQAGMLADGGAEIVVRDTGIGIARDHLPRLTERFYRVDGSRSRDTGGTGLGLAIVKHIVQRHGGNLDIQSELGNGSTFRIVLPTGRVRRSAPLFLASGSAPPSTTDAALHDHSVVPIAGVAGFGHPPPAFGREREGRSATH